MEKSLNVMDRLFMAVTFGEAGEPETALQLLQEEKPSSTASRPTRQRDKPPVLAAKPVPHPL